MGDFYELIKGIVGLAVINMGLIVSLNLRFVRSGLQTQFKVFSEMFNLALLYILMIIRTLCVLYFTLR